MNLTILLAIGQLLLSVAGRLETVAANGRGKAHGFEAKSSCLGRLSGPLIGGGCRLRFGGVGLQHSVKVWMRWTPGHQRAGLGGPDWRERDLLGYYCVPAKPANTTPTDNTGTAQGRAIVQPLDNTASYSETCSAPY
jgi:hypothetical protein